MKKPLLRRYCLPVRRERLFYSFAADPCKVLFVCTEKQQEIVVERMQFSRTRIFKIVKKTPRFNRKTFDECRKEFLGNANPADPESEVKSFPNLDGNQGITHDIYPF